MFSKDNRCQVLPQDSETQQLLIEGVRQAEKEGAVVEWSQEDGVDYVDVITRSRFGPFIRTVFVRCYGSNRELSVSDLQALKITSSQSGSHIVMVIGEGKKAIQLAKIKGIVVLTLDVLSHVPKTFWPDLFKPGLSVYGFRFKVVGQQIEIAIPEEPALLAYMMRELKVVGPDIDTTPEAIVEQNDGEFVELATSTQKTFSVQLPENTSMIHPNSSRSTPISAFSCDYRLIALCGFVTKEGLGTDHYLLGSTLKDDLVKKNPEIDAGRIGIGFDTKLQSGKYYYNPTLQFSYYCESARKGTARLVLIESYQGGNLLQARVMVSTQLSPQYVEVTAPSELARLSELYEKFKVSDKNLEGRFTAFIKGLEGAECIDELELTREQERAQKADYFINNRTIVSEFKSLETDTSAKLNAILEPHRNRPEWPVFFGPQDLQTILAYLPDRQEINAKIVNALTDSIEAIIEKANRQIRATKEKFGLPDAGGLLVIFNEAVESFSPDVVAYRIKKTLRKKTRTREVRFPEITVVLVINAGHYSKLTPTLQGNPILVMPSGLPDPNGIEAFASSLLPKWCAFEGVPLVRIETEMFPKLSFERISRKKEEKPKPLTPDEYWRGEYRHSPYLRDLTKKDLLHYGGKLLEDIGPRFLKDAPQTPKDYLSDLMARFTHFLEEANFRAIDMRELELEGFKERLESFHTHHQQGGSTHRPPESKAKQKRVSRANKNKVGRGAPCPCQSGKLHRRCCGRKPQAASSTTGS